MFGDHARADLRLGAEPRALPNGPRSKTPIRDTSCCRCHPLTGVPCSRSRTTQGGEIALALASALNKKVEPIVSVILVDNNLCGPKDIRETSEAGGARGRVSGAGAVRAPLQLPSLWRTLLHAL